MPADLYSLTREKLGNAPVGVRPPPLHPAIPARRPAPAPAQVIERPHLAVPQQHGGLQAEPPSLDAMGLRRYNFHGTTGAPITQQGQQMAQARADRTFDQLANIGTQTGPQGQSSGRAQPPPVPEAAKRKAQPQQQQQQQASQAQQQQAAQAQSQATQQAQPQAQQSQPAPQGQPQQAAPSTWGDWVNSAMNAARGGAANAQNRAASGWNAVSPENRATLQNAATTAKTWGGRALKGGLAAGGLYAGYRMLGGGGQSAEEQNARMQDYLANAQHQMAQPVPSMTVLGSYDEFARSKLAALAKRADPVNTLNGAHSAMAGAFGQALAQKLVTEPIDNAHRFLKKKIVDGPKAHTTFHSVVQEDPMLRDAYAQNPEGLEETFKAMRKFGPSMSTSPAVVRSFLRQSTMAGGNMDFATIRLLAETEKFVQNARGRRT